MSLPFTCTDGAYLFVLLLVLLAAAPASANFESLLMPGEVIEGHAEYEQQCERCHAKFSKTDQNTLCLDCHDKVAVDIDAGQGYHGRAPEVGQTDCKYCHTDHKGRDARIVLLDQAAFDHKRTDFHLKGAHATAVCAACHPPQKPFRDAPDRCIDCHEDDDRHGGRLGQQCGDCHQATRWSKHAFDHDKTNFRLELKHDQVLCAACHPNQRYKDTPRECASCHRVDDVHRGAYGDKCQTCHTPAKWKQVRFDHDRKTDFKLLGNHRDLTCTACHRSGRGDDKPSKTCIGCHRGDDEHQGRNGEQCDSCHTNVSWRRARFDHTRDAKVELTGKHADVACRLCHPGGVEKRKTPRQCSDCHRPDDVHDGELGQACSRCHDDAGWLRVAFDHDLTRFPLNGLHAVAPCEACHASRKYTDVPTACGDCHRNDDVHKGGLGATCAQCHNPNAWLLWRFDHDRQTDFKLTGSHRGIVCRACHAEATDPARQSAVCIDCHQGDDAHSGRFGRRCDRCHNTESFREIELAR